MLQEHALIGFQLQKYCSRYSIVKAFSIRDWNKDTLNLGTYTLPNIYNAVIRLGQKIYSNKPIAS